MSRLTGHRASLLSMGSAAASLAARRLSLDVLHDLTGLAPWALPSRARRVITVHDLISHLPDPTNDLADDLIQRHWLPRAAPRADAVITVSATTGRDAERFLGVPADRIHVVHHGVDPRFRVLGPETVEPWRERLRLPSDFVLFVGSASPRKNLPALVEACRTLWSSGVEVPLVVAGPARPQEISGVDADLAAGRIRALGFVAEAQLPLLYNAATVLAYPSSYEGFGLPALEAMRCGTPVVVGRGGALPEVVGAAGVLVTPTDATAIAGELGRVLRDEEHRRALRERGLDHARQFTWPAAASRTATVYRQVARSMR
jgi:glycosyltransferase involved in cell wall biosynthesis